MTQSPPKLIPFPKQALQASIPSELIMPREIAKDAVSVELIADRLTDAGYEVDVEKDDNTILVQRTGINLRLQVFPDLNSIRIRSHYFLNRHLTEEDITKLLVRLNDEIYLPKYTHYRWNDGDVGLFAGYAIHYTFGLNMPNLIFSMRRFVDTQQGVYLDYIKGTAYAYVEEEQRPEVINSTAEQKGTVDLDEADGADGADGD
jgi:hypothetical protein